MLGESGLWEDEEGNLYSSSELEGYEPMDTAIQKNISERLKKVSATRCLLARNIKCVCTSTGMERWSEQKNKGKKALHLQNTISQFYTNNFI